MAEEVSWQILASQDLDREQQPHLRVSSAGACPRRQAYAFMGQPETNHANTQGKNRMAMGHMAELLMIREMQETGWETSNTVLSPDGQLELEIEIPGTGVTMKGHPDGRCRHEEFTRNNWVPLECKSMGPEMARQVAEQGIRAVYPKYFHQIALYARRLFDLKMVSHAERGIFAIMDREGRMLPPERIPWETWEYEEILVKEKNLILEARTGRVPDRPFEQSSSDCKYCPYYNLCWNVQEPERDDRGRTTTVEIQEEAVLRAAREWAELKPRLDKARDMLQASSNSNGGNEVLADGVLGSYFSPRHEITYDNDELERMVPADILRKCLKDVKRKPLAFWVRTAKR